MLGELRISISTPSDAPELRRLAQLENRHAFSCPALLARIDGVAVAALSLDGADAVADPFRPTARVIEALRAIAATGRGVHGRSPGLTWLVPFPRYRRPHSESCAS